MFDTVDQAVTPQHWLCHEPDARIVGIQVDNSLSFQLLAGHLGLGTVIAQRRRHGRPFSNCGSRRAARQEMA
jgi:hypothetical protein